jgi:sugar lactone lactonase YvrE
MAADGTLYASDPKFSAQTGQIWRITRGADGKGDGELMSSTRPHTGVTNGIDLSPDGATLYVSESDTLEVWAYRLEGTKLLDARLVRKFPDFEVDGLRTDVDARIFLARPSAGKVAVIVADGTLVREIALRGKGPTNLTFGGADGKTVFVTQTDVPAASRQCRAPPDHSRKKLGDAARRRPRRNRCRAGRHFAALRQHTCR